MRLRALFLAPPLLFFTPATATQLEASDFPNFLKPQAPTYSSTTTLTATATRTIRLLPIPTSSSIPQMSNSRAITITNNCSDTLWPGILSTNGTGPWTHGFELPAGRSEQIWVGSDWVGRIWGRTNCTFEQRVKPAQQGEYEYVGKCKTGDCGGKLDCAGITGQPPTTLAEFTITGFKEMTYYDISLVDGYSLDMQIIPESTPQGVNPDTLSPKCIATEKKNLRWCPWDLQQSPPSKGPYDAYFWQPDDRIQRPFFNPCFSACAAWGNDKDCCVGKFNDPELCKPSLYSHNAKYVCNDAYTYAYDDRLSTFTVPSGKGFEVIFCPAGESTKILERRTSNASSSMTWKGTSHKKLSILVAIIMVPTMIIMS